MSANRVLFDAQGPHGRRLTRIFNIVALVLAAALVAAVLVQMHRMGQLDRERWAFLFTGNAWANFFLPGLWGTLKAALVSVVTSVAFGLIFGMGRLSHIRVLAWASTLVVEFFRAVPVLVMMIFFYTGMGHLALLNPNLLPFASVVLGLTLYNGSVIAELVRSGVHQLPNGQREAGLAIGLRPGQVLRGIQLPQALVAMMPALLSQFVVILKDTALGYIITYGELLDAAKRLGAANSMLQALLMSALIFIVINLLLTTLAHRLSGYLSYRVAVKPKV